MTDFILDTGFLGLPAAKGLAETAPANLLAVTVAPDCKNYADVFTAVHTAFTQTAIYAGAQRPTLRDAPPARKAPISGSTPPSQKDTAANVIIDLATKHPHVAIVCLGPLTNIALAIMKNPAATGSIGKIVVAGGAQLGHSGVTETAEYNIYTDPEAADTVMNSGIPVVLIPAEASADYRAAALAYMLEPTVATETYEAFIDIDIAGSKTYGQTVIDPIGWNPINNRQHTGKKNVIVAAVNDALVKKVLTEGWCDA